MLSRSSAGLAVFALIAALTIPASAQPDTTTTSPEVIIGKVVVPPSVAPVAVPVIAYWEKGDERTVVVDQGKNHFANGDLVSADSSTMTYRVVVEVEAADHYLVRWTPVAYASSDPVDDVLRDVDAELVAQLDEEGYLIRTNELGTFEALENIETVRALSASVLDALTEGEEDPEMRDKMREFMDKLGGAEFVMQKTIEPILLYYQPYGYEWSTASQAYHEELPMPGGGGTVAAPGTVKATDIDEENGTFRLTNRIVADPESLREGIIDLLALAGTPREDLVREMEGYRFDMRDENVFVIDYVDGVVQTLDRLRIVEFAGDRREQFVTVRVLSE